MSGLTHTHSLERASTRTHRRLAHPSSIILFPPALHQRPQQQQHAAPVSSPAQPMQQRTCVRTAARGRRGSSDSSNPPSSQQQQQPQQSQQQEQPRLSTYQQRTVRRRASAAKSFVNNDSYDEEMEQAARGPTFRASASPAPRFPTTPFPSLSSMDTSLSSMDQGYDAPSIEDLLPPSMASPASGQGGSLNGDLSNYIAQSFPSASQPPSSSGKGRRSSLPAAYYTGNGVPGTGAAGGTRDPFAAFRAFQQGGGDIGLLEGGGHLQAFRRANMPKLRKGWYASQRYTAEQLSQEILGRCERKPCGMPPLFMLIRLCKSQEDARTALATISAVRAAAARLQGNLVPFMNESGHNLARAFTVMCCDCDASDVLASALIHANEVGLPLTYRSVHLAMAHWAQLQELPKMDQVLEAMPQGGLPFTPKTAYVVIRAAVNSGRQDVAEMYAARMMASGVRLHQSVNMLLEVGRERARQRAVAMQGSEDE